MKKNALKAFLALASVSLLVGVQQNADAAIFKCVNAQGKTYYNDKACSKSDQETQLDNVKDPVGGYIPPAFKADVKIQGSKGVFVGEKTDENNSDERSEDISGSERIDNSDSSGSSGSSDLSTAASNDGAEENIKSASTERTKSKGVPNKPLPRVPLKTETVTREPRSKIN